MGTRTASDVQQPIPFAAIPFLDLGEDGTAVLTGSKEYRIFVLRPDRKRSELNAGIAPAAVSDFERDSATTYIRQMGGFASQVLSAQGEAAIETIPQNHPAISALKVMRDGSIWVRRVPELGSAVARWDVFDSANTVAEYANLPANQWVADGTLDQLFAIEYKDDSWIAVKLVRAEK